MGTGWCGLIRKTMLNWRRRRRQTILDLLFRWNVWCYGARWCPRLRFIGTRRLEHSTVGLWWQRLLSFCLRCLDNNILTSTPFFPSRWYDSIVHIFDSNNVNNRGIARNSFWVGINFLLHNTTVQYTNSMTSSAEISAQNNFQWLILGGYIYRYTPRRYSPG